MQEDPGESSASYVPAQRGQQLTLFHLMGPVTGIAGAAVGCKYGFHHGGILPAFGGAVTGFLIGGVLCFPVAFLFMVLPSIPELTLTFLRWAARKVFPAGRNR